MASRRLNSKTGQSSRRSFLAKVAAGWGTASALSLSPKSYAQVLGANDDLRFGVVGFNGHGKTHISRYLKQAGVRIVALCDPDQAVLDRGKQMFQSLKQNIDTYVDLRKLLDRSDIDAVSGAQPNHWHALYAVWGCQAGKDVCVEKPVSHCLWEGRKIVEAARKYDRIVQADLDRRTDDRRAQAIAWVQAGNLGKILRVHAFVYKRRQSIGKVPGPQQPPATVDYNLWCGPRPTAPLMRSKFHYDWHWQFDFGNGETGNNGPHVLDESRWSLGERGLPKRVVSIGGRFGYDDDGDTPNSQFSVFDYDTAPIIFEVRGLPRSPQDPMMPQNPIRTATGTPIGIGNADRTANNNVVVVCEGGYLHAPAAYDNDGKLIKQFEAQQHRDIGYWFPNAMRSRKLADLRTDIEEGHLSTSLCHMANISYRIGAEGDPREALEAIRDCPGASQTYELFRENLLTNGIDIAADRLTVGPWLEMDSATERFVGGPSLDRANQLLKDEYRSPFVIPETV